MDDVLCVIDWRQDKGELVGTYSSRPHSSMHERDHILL